MKAVQITEFGGPEVMRVTELPVPRPGPGEVLVRVAAAGVNLADTRMRSGHYPVPLRLPFVPGFELSGHVDSVGPGAASLARDPRVLAPGTPVVAVHAHAAYAEYALVPADMLLPLPEGIDVVAAAAVPVAYSVAWMALHDRGGLRPHETVLVHAAGSGVGLAAVQLAAAAGAEVIALASTQEKLDLARAAGASVALGYQPHYPTDDLHLWLDRGADLLIDGVGGPVLAEGLSLLRPGGRAVCFGQSAGEPIDLDLYRAVIPRQLDLRGLARGALVDSRDPRDRGLVADAVAHVLDLWARGALADPVVHRLPLAEAAEAHAAMSDRSHTGKLTLVPD
ncbi:quinone oxidoreductase family protein [Aeromicrobium choanae]|uniref:NADPH2:quinone reductase n=1 Tax=Aeromicrobium choanae TaxID=1736691 RepID=A0A1T4Z4G7_9ACTN|nr:zinc-binding dehydrogenase [Aeromicrobium choanae]SKB08967.1 NADPH2:quinone reductase [Aeromicrobium choanae]